MFRRHLRLHSKGSPILRNVEILLRVQISWCSWVDVLHLLLRIRRDVTCVRSEFACALSSPLPKPMLAKTRHHLHGCTVPAPALSSADLRAGGGWTQLFGALGSLMSLSGKHMALWLYRVTALLREGLMVFSLGFPLRPAWALTGSFISVEFLAQKSRCTAWTLV